MFFVLACIYQNMHASIHFWCCTKVGPFRLFQDLHNSRSETAMHKHAGKFHTCGCVHVYCCVCRCVCGCGGFHWFIHAGGGGQRPRCMMHVGIDRESDIMIVIFFSPYTKIWISTHFKHCSPSSKKQIYMYMCVCVCVCDTTQDCSPPSKKKRITLSLSLPPSLSYIHIYIYIYSFSSICI